jgi:hypothetical protein
MRKLTRFSVLAASLLLLAVPTAWACDELTGAMLGCSQTETDQAPTDAMCHEDGRASMDCCATHPDPEPEQSLAFESARVPLSLEESSNAPAEELAVAQHLAAPETSLPSWRGQECYILFSSFLL